MAAWCGGCAQLRSSMHPRWPTCKRQRLCSVLDSSLISLLAERSPSRKCEFERAYEAQTAIGQGHFVATRVCDAFSFPGTPSEFADQLLQLHRCLFDGSGFDFAGRFRTGNEHVEFGGAYSHRRCGADPMAIPALIERLGSLFFRGDPQALTREEFIQQAAWFLGEFFRIHPFRDGNGRVARLMLKVAGNGSRVVRLGVWPSNSRSRRKYVKALQYAHKASDLNSVRRHPNDPAGLRPLIGFLGGVILDREEDEPFQEEPPD